MAMTNAERQRQYRQRREGQSQRLNLLVSRDAKQALEQMAVQAGLSQQAMLERILIEAQGRTLDGLAKPLRGNSDTPEEPGEDQPLRSNADHTPIPDRTAAILARHAAGIPLRQIAREFGYASDNSIRHILKRARGDR